MRAFSVHESANCWLWQTKVTPIVEGYGGWAFRMEIVPMESAYPGFGELVVSFRDCSIEYRLMRDLNALLPYFLFFPPSPLDLNVNIMIFNFWLQYI